MYDVIVVGAGPGGAACAKRCAENKQKTLLLEKEQLPREKICGGMVMGPVADALIRQEYGAIPESVLSRPAYLDGYIVHVPGVGEAQIENRTALAFRKNLDYWMDRGAQAKGVEIRDGARVLGVEAKGKGFAVEVESGSCREKLEAKYLVGADGTGSIVRSLLFPELKITYRQAYQEAFRGGLSLEPKRYHWFLSVDYHPPFFSVHQKDGFVLINVNGELGKVKDYMQQAKAYLAANYELDINQKPAWRHGCVELKLHQELVTHTFRPARGNALLVGDAATFVLPVSGEGIGTAIKSGLAAADAIIKSSQKGLSPDTMYLDEIESIIKIISQLDPWHKKMTATIQAGGKNFDEVVRDAYRSTLIMF